jgi:formylglycine-generating enzyme required for sulfatase activity
MQAPKGSLVLYATSPGDVAQDGMGRNGVFTSKLLEYMDRPGLPIENVFKKTAISVSKATDRKQVPWFEGVLLGEFSFKGSANKVETPMVEKISWREDVMTGMEFKWIAPGCRVMGSNENDKGRFGNEVLRENCIQKGFWVGTYEVSNEQYRKYQSTHNSSKYKSLNLNHPSQPVVLVSWEQAVEYSEWLSEQTGFKFRLPTEYEWEFVAKGGQIDKNFYKNPKQICNYENIADKMAQQNFKGWTKTVPCHDGEAVTAKVGTYDPNKMGLYDLLGNVRELTCTEYRATNRHCVNETKKQIIVRGAAWSDSVRFTRISAKRKMKVTQKSKYVGFRLIRE